MRAALAPYAADPADSRGRLYLQAESVGRDAFQRDRDRIIHSTAFRRLKHKTQVFVSAFGDHYRTRLTHSLEVAQIARSIARQLDLNEDLTEALALAHDLGHTAFGHTGEDVLDARMAPFGGFDHNAHTVRIVTELEQRYVDFDGLNLSWETLEGLAKHNGPVARPPWALADYVARHDLELGTFASAEAQVAALSDDIAYNTHDIDDGLRAGLFSLDELLAEVPLVADTWRAVQRRHPSAPQARLVAELIRDLIGRLVEDVLAETRHRLRRLAPASSGDVRAADAAVVAFSAGLAPAEKELKHFLRTRMYHHYKVTLKREAAKQIIATLFDRYFEEPSVMPAEWSARLAAAEERHAAVGKARTVADFIAGMTDLFAIREVERLTGQVPGDL